MALLSSLPLEGVKQTGQASGEHSSAGQGLSLCHPSFLRTEMALHHQMTVHMDTVGYSYLMQLHSHCHVLRSNIKQCLGEKEGGKTYTEYSESYNLSYKFSMKYMIFFGNSTQHDAICTFISCTFFCHHWVLKVTGLFLWCTRDVQSAEKTCSTLMQKIELNDPV